MPKRNCLAIILAAGEGTRMRSSLPKVMHMVGGLPMLAHVLATAKAAGALQPAVVIGPNSKQVGAFAKEISAEAVSYKQMERLGTAHAVLAARKAFATSPDDVVILYGDTPLLSAATLKRLRSALAKGADVVVLGFRSDNPEGYGRLLVEKGNLVAIREQKDASKSERAVNFCNAGVMGFRGTVAPLIRSIGNDNAKGEYYLTDLVAIAHDRGLKVVALEGDENEFLGVNSRSELARAERIFQDRARQSAMASGVTMIAPETVWFSYDTKLARDVTIEPNVFFGPGVTINEGATVRANSHIEGTVIGRGASVGPFARLRPGTDLGTDVHVGNFVELKNARVADSAKIGHLSYVGDAAIGSETNIGAGTITCNYDGYEKHHTEIGANAFIGSNSALVAPVRIGDGAYVASGSVITDEVPANALAIARGRQVTKPGRAARLRSMKAGGRRKRD